MNEDIALIWPWARENGLTLGASKTHLEYCSENNSMPKILLGEMTFKFMKCTVKNLSVIMDKNFTFNAHAKNLSSKVFSRLRLCSP